MLTKDFSKEYQGNQTLRKKVLKIRFMLTMKVWLKLNMVLDVRK